MTQDAAKAYRAASAHTADPRHLEADLLLKAAARMQAVHDSWQSNTSDLSDALLYNRKLWLLLIASVTSPDNPLPAAIRQNVANLGLFVMKQILAMTVHPQPEQLSPLIRINCDIAAGLLGRA
jgi:flagellar biosynthesis activator protein FlaF